MANSFSYDHPHYVHRRFDASAGLAGTSTSTGAPHVSAFAENLWNAHYRVDVAGTLTSAAVRVINVTSGLSTSTIATTTVGTAVAGSTYAMNSLTAGVTPTSLAAGSITYASIINDTTSQVRVVWEYQVPSGTTVTASIG